MNDDDILFIDDEVVTINDSTDARLSPWKVLIIDDDEEMHAVTKLVLSSFEWEDIPLHFLSAYSAYEAELLFKEHQDIAVALIDVVMETDDAGLRLIKMIRDTLNNKETRLILRTGQPGQAPERRIIREYDISDYKNKTELSGIKLDTLMCNALRAYQSVMSLKKNKQGLEIVVASSSALFESPTYESLVKVTMDYLTQLVRLCTCNVTYTLSSLGLYCNPTIFHLIETTEKFSHLSDVHDIDKLPDDVSILITQSIREEQHIYTDNAFVMNISSSSDSSIIIYFEGFLPLTEQDIALLDLFAANAKTSFDNEELRHEVSESQREIVYLLGEVIEHKSKETGNHIRRVAEITRVLALELGYSVKEAEKIKSASPLHDLGKIGIPDSILHKPRKLDSDEWEVMKTHVELGHDLIRHSNQDVLKYAAIISYQHHERWDGTGYPNGLKGEEIDLVGRIAALADVFDALAHDRCYKKAWPMHEVITFIEQQAGLHFDPKVVAAFKKNQQKIIEINEQYADMNN